MSLAALSPVRTQSILFEDSDPAERLLWIPPGTRAGRAGLAAAQARGGWGIGRRSWGRRPRWRWRWHSTTIIPIRSNSGTPEHASSQVGGSPAISMMPSDPFPGCRTEWISREKRCRFTSRCRPMESFLRLAIQRNRCIEIAGEPGGGTHSGHKFDGFLGVVSLPDCRSHWENRSVSP